MSKKPLSFEEKLAKLEKLIEELKSENVSLQDTINKYELGMNLIKGCQSDIKSFEEKLVLLSKESDGGLKKQSASMDDFKTK